ncbi:hypothetical protein M9H77_06244 [Catharanthus roseus]|uniref:Uncharacterized protein n=1 Tax=Catharanthus roseus TaxID=4058 RepID=A0ACC0BRQ7_CATRO|nr:hypothetical protein M9H77_06244 [Catharanthus roseus]
MTNKRIVQCNSTQQKVMNCVAKIIHEVQVPNSSKVEWELKRKKSAAETAEILAKFAPLARHCDQPLHFPPTQISFISLSPWPLQPPSLVRPPLRLTLTDDHWTVTDTGVHHRLIPVSSFLSLFTPLCFYLFTFALCFKEVVADAAGAHQATASF